LVRIEAFLRRLVVVRRDREKTGRVAARHLARCVDHLTRVVAAGAGENRHAPARLVDEDLDGAQAFGVGERRVLARRAAGTQKMDACVDLPASEPANGGFIELAAARERRDQRGADSCEWPTHRYLPWSGWSGRSGGAGR